MTNLLAAIVITLVTNTTETVTGWDQIEWQAATWTDGIYSGPTYKKGAPTEKRIDTIVCERTGIKFTLDGQAFDLEVCMREISRTSQTLKRRLVEAWDRGPVAPAPIIITNGTLDLLLTNDPNKILWLDRAGWTNGQPRP